MALIGDLSITTQDGTVLRATTDLRLAALWAAYEVNANAELPEWEDLSYRDQVGYTVEALTELRRVYGDTDR